MNKLVDALTAPLSEDLKQMQDDERDRWLLAQLLNWHRREAKSFWWRYFYLSNELTDAERREEPDALGELIFKRSWPDPSPKARSTIYRFRFPPQEHDIKVDDTPHDPEIGKSVGTIVHLDDDAGIIDIKRGNSRPAPTPTSLIPYTLVGTKPQRESLQRLALWVLGHGIDEAGSYRAARALLARQIPRVGQAGGRAASDRRRGYSGGGPPTCRSARRELSRDSGAARFG